MKQKRSLGQVFLENKKYINKITDCLDIQGKTVLEIGSGKGALSGYISERAARLFCVELDSRFCAYLQQRFSQKNNTEVINCDILKFPLSKLGKDIVVFGNVPYQISSKLISYLADYRKYIKCVYLTLQKEFVDKLTAPASSKDYSFISCFFQYYAKVNKLFEIPASSFYPAPKVDSKFIEFTFNLKPPFKANDEDYLFKLIRKAFSSRRKKIMNSLKINGDKGKFFKSLDIDPNLRPENVSLKNYVDIANKFCP